MEELSYSSITSSKEPIDIILDKIFNKKENGVFIELGGYNGLTQSNTAFFEFYRNWTGIIVEPSNRFKECIENRPKSKCFNFACVSDDYIEDTIKIDNYNNLMTSINGLRIGTTTLVDVKTSTLTKIIDSTEIKEIDFLSLDAEGYEYEILKGLDFNKYRPKYILIEVYIKDQEIIEKHMLENNYELVMNLTNYNKNDNPGWDGTHNDFLFKCCK